MNKLRLLIAALTLVPVALAQETIPSVTAQTGQLGPEYLSPSEVSAAISAPPNSGFVFIEDVSFKLSLCQAQMPSIAIFTPAGWINALSQGAKQRLLDFTPKPEDTRRVLTIVSKGCVGQTINDSMWSITRVVLLSTDHNRKIEAAENHQLTNSWQNSYGASVTTANLVSKFSVDDLKKIQEKNGEFAVATMNDTRITKIYTVKTKHLKKLGLQ